MDEFCVILDVISLLYQGGMQFLVPNKESKESAFLGENFFLPMWGECYPFSSFTHPSSGEHALPKARHKNNILILHLWDTPTHTDALIKDIFRSLS